jgi:hypothetical protein
MANREEACSLLAIRYSPFPYPLFLNPAEIPLIVS